MSEKDKDVGTEPTENEGDDPEQSVSENDDLLRNVREVEEMTRTVAWKKLWRSKKDRIARLEHDLPSEDNSKTITRMQVGVLLLRGFFKELRYPIDDLRGFARNNPLLVDGLDVLPEWDKELGRVLWRDRESGELLSSDLTQDDTDGAINTEHVGE